MKLKDKFLVQKVEDELLAVPIDGTFNGVLRVNSEMAFLLSLLNEEIAEEEVIEKMKAEYGITEERAKNDCGKVLNMLRENGLLLE